MAPVLPSWFLAISFSYCALLGARFAIRYKDWSILSLLPSFIYMSIFYFISPYLAVDTWQAWHDWGMFGFSVCFTVLLIWRYSYLVRGDSWKK